MTEKWTERKRFIYDILKKKAPFEDPSKHNEV